MDAYLFTQVTHENCLALLFAKGFGWGTEINLRYVFEKVPGSGYPQSAALTEKANAIILNDLKKVSHQDIKYVLKI